MTGSSARSALMFLTVPLSVSIQRSELRITSALLSAHARHGSRPTARSSTMKSRPAVVRITSYRGRAAMPVGRLLIGVRHLQDRRLIERFTDQLQPDRQS